MCIGIWDMDFQDVCSYNVVNRGQGGVQKGWASTLHVHSWVLHGPGARLVGVSGPLYHTNTGSQGS